MARRVLPTPLVPTRLTSRAATNVLRVSANSRRRPTKLVASAGRLPIRRLGLGTVSRTLARPKSGPVDYASNPLFGRCGRGAVGPSVVSMDQHPTTQRVEVTFVGNPPTRQI